MTDPFTLVTGVISLVVVTLQVTASVSKMLDKTIAAHRAADEELERLRCNLEELQSRMESNHEKLMFLASNTKDRGFKKLLQRYAVSPSG
jgi:CHASE1-domain containing sensor protein